MTKLKLSIKLLILFVLITSSSCSNKGNENTEDGSNDREERSGNSDDTTMTPEEVFSSALVQDILGDEEDVDLQYYLEEEIYPLLSTAGKVTIDRISSSLYLLSFQENGIQKNILIKKFFDPQNTEIKFERTETQSGPENQFLK
ncbi:MAG TPA: hypothetical protein PK536_01430 [Ignavibacteria bacterium]|nr:hypothetical protein [Bacteroidota bacterium]HRI84087.1 hypothetical protein [Ignavibacteria bacterium]